MLIIPAIDIQAGEVVRFVQGKRDKKVYSKDPVKTAKHWAKQGARFLHVVDLDGAFQGKPANLNIVKEIARAVSVPVEFGGGLRKIETINGLLKSGVQRVILGTKAIEDKAFLKKAFAKFKEKVIVSLDARDFNLVVRGWKAASRGKDIFEFARDLKEMGFKELIYTDTLKDGTLKGPNIKTLKALLKKSGINIIASGGVSSLEDLHKLKGLEKEGLTGVIIGKALYEGKFTLSDALRFS
ncbi:MAG: 1-(5-phosphoribosyl)-5-[(5-phosphoribosylamino)methylideneamino]imidazole-4-carboxamide isomerase [Candidatus Omnitrophota bacterium]